MLIAKQNIVVYYIYFTAKCSATGPHCSLIDRTEYKTNLQTYDDIYIRMNTRATKNKIQSNTHLFKKVIIKLEK